MSGKHSKSVYHSNNNGSSVISPYDDMLGMF